MYDTNRSINCLVDFFIYKLAKHYVITNLMKNNKYPHLLLSLIALTALLQTGCVSSQHEEGNRVNILPILNRGLVTYERDYSLQGFVSNDALTVESYRATGVIPEDSIGYDYQVRGSKLGFLWGLLSFKWD